MARAGCWLAPLALICAACSGGNAGPTGAQRPPPLVQVSTVAPVDQEILRAYLVTLQSGEAVNVVSRASGYVVAWLADRGDRVRRGQRLALIEREELSDQQRGAAAGLQAAQANLENALLQAERLEKLLRQQLVSQAEVDNARTQLHLAQAQVASAQAALGLSETRAGYSNIASPFDGLVISRSVEVGTMVGPGGAPLFVIGSIANIKAIAAVPQADLPAISIGMPVTLRIEGLSDALAGVVKRIAPALDPLSRTMDVEMEFSNPDGALRPGMFGRAEVVLRTLRQVVLLPPLACSRREDGALCFVVRDGKAAEVQIRLGETLADGRVVAADGLRAGDSLVLIGRDLLRDGMPVRTVAAKP